MIRTIHRLVAMLASLGSLIVLAMAGGGGLNGW